MQKNYPLSDFEMSWICAIFNETRYLKKKIIVLNDMAFVCVPNQFMFVDILDIYPQSLPTFSSWTKNIDPELIVELNKSLRIIDVCGCVFYWTYKLIP